MKGKLRIWMYGLIFLFVIVANSSASIYSHVREDTVIITGTVEAYKWDENDSITAVVISVEIVVEDPTEEVHETEYEDYYVYDTIEGRELLTMVGETVEATGVVEEDENGNKTIFVLSYRVIKEE